MTLKSLRSSHVAIHDVHSKTHINWFVSSVGPVLDTRTTRRAEVKITTRVTTAVYPMRAIIHPLCSERATDTVPSLTLTLHYTRGHPHTNSRANTISTKRQHSCFLSNNDCSYPITCSRAADVVGPSDCLCLEGALAPTVMYRESPETLA